MKKTAQAGFTLIEIIITLVLLGVLSAVAVPKYTNLVDEAEKSAAVSAIAEVQSQLTQQFAVKLLQGKTCTDAVTDVYTDKTITTGKYAVAFTVAAKKVTVSNVYKIAGDTHIATSDPKITPAIKYLSFDIPDCSTTE